MAREFSKKFYNSKIWEDCRQYIFNKYHGLCAECEAPGEEVHHIIPLNPYNINDPDITSNENNLVLLCRKCHFNKHRYTNPWKENLRKKKKKVKKKRLTDNGMYFDEEGNYMKCKTYIVYGSPASGKSTYVKENMKDGDLIVDLDLIKQSISLRGKTDAPYNLLDMALGIRDYIYTRIEEDKVDSKNTWIVSLLPDKKERDALAERLGAELIYIDATLDECIERAEADADRINKELQKQIIEEWFAKYKA